MCQLFLKEDVYQLLEFKRERVRHVAARTLQRYTRMFLLRSLIMSFRWRVVALQARCRGFLARYTPSVWFPTSLSLYLNFNALLH